MQTKTLTFDFSYLRDKKIASANENSGIRKYHLAEEGVWSLLDIQRTRGINKFEPTTFLDLIRSSIVYLDHFFDNKYIQIKMDGNDTKYKFIYSIHSEPKEFFSTVYIGKETGNVYFSNQGDDIVFSNIRDIIPTLDVKTVIRAIQIFKITHDIQPLQEALFVIKDDVIDGSSKYLDIFHNKSLIQTKAIYNAVDDVTRIRDFIKHFMELSFWYRPFIISMRLVSLMITQGVGRISKLSDDMEEMITDFNKILCPPRVAGRIVILNDDELHMESCKDISRDLSSEYYAYDINIYNRDVRVDYRYKNGMTFKSLIENSEDEEATLYSEEFLKKLSATLNVDYSIIMNRMKDIKEAYLRKIYSTKINSHAVRKKDPDASMMNLMFATEKMGYKYIKRIHDILSRL